MKNKFLTGLISAFSFLLFNSIKAQVPIVDFALDPTVTCVGSTVQINDLSTNLPTEWTYTLGGAPATSTLQNPIVVFNAPGIYTISLIASNTNGLGVVTSKTIEVNALPQLTVSGNPNICAGQSAILTANGADTYAWSTGSAIDTETFSPNTTTNYTVTGTNTLTGCSANNEVIITVNSLPVLSVTGGTALCLGASLTQTLNGADTYTLDGLALGSNTVLLNPTSNTNYTLEGTNISTGCYNSTMVTIVVNSLPTVSIAGSASVCAGLSVVQTASGTDTYLWSDGSSSDVATFTPVTTSVYTVTGTNTLTGCSDDETVSVSVVAIPTLVLTGTDTYCAGGSASQTVTGADSYVWSTGSIADNEVFNPSTSTNYSVTGTNTLTGCSATNTLQITVNTLPILSISGSAAVCIGSTITPTLSGADTYTWNGVVATNNTVSLSPTTNTNYTLEGTNAATGCYNSTIIAISVNPLPTITVIGDNTVCAGSSVIQTASGADTYVWSNGGTADAATLTPVSTSVYTVTGTNTLTGCSNTETSSVSVIALPTLTLTGTDTYCAGGSASQTVTGADSYLWSTGSTADNEVFSPAVTTVYSVSGTSAATGCSATNTLQITVNNLPVLGVSGNGSVCIGSSVTQTLSGANTYTWNGVAVTNNTISLNPTVNTSYTLEGTNMSTGCYNSTIITIAVNPLPIITITGNATVCAGSQVVQTAGGADNYLWDDNTATDAATFSPIANTVYTVTGTNTLTGCSDIATVSVTAIGLPTLTLTGTNSYCEGGSATQTVSGADSYSWSTGATTDNETFNPANTTTYSVTGTNTITGCLSTIPVIITVNAIPTITVNSGAVCAGSIFTMVPSGASTYTYSSITATVIPLTNAAYSVTGTSTEGCVSSNTAIATVTVNALPMVSINDATICAGTVFTIQPTGGSTFTIEGNSNTVSPATSTSYTISSQSAEGCLSSNTATLNLTVNALPTLTISGNIAICAGQTTTLSASGANTYTWTNLGTNTTVTDSPMSNTTYSVSGTDLNGCINSTSRQVTVNVIPTLTVSGGTICQGGSFVLSPVGANTYTYSGGSNTVSPNTTTNYTVAGSSAEGCVSQNAVATVSVVNAITLTVSGDLTICAGLNTTLTANGASTYTWSNGGSTAVILPAPAANTSYTVTGFNGPCTNSTVVTVTVNALPTLTVVSSAPVICLGNTASLTVSGAGTYSWSTLETSTTITVSPTSNVNYTVAGLDANGCSSAAIITQSVDACTGIESLSGEAFTIGLYPNPNNGEFNLKVDQDVLVTVLNNLGQTVYANELQKGIHEIRLEDQVNGIYFVTITRNNQSKTIKMIKL